MRDLIATFREKETRDELGLGAIRDSLADQLFPGTSTIQTRARYFLFVPWIYQDLERRRVPVIEVEKLARRNEIRLITALRTGGEEEGIIGARAGDELERLPSSIYWAGLGRLGIRKFNGSREQYHREFSGFRLHSSRRLHSEDEETAANLSWSGSLPEAPSSLLDKCTFEVSKREARYLAERIWECGSTVFGKLLDEPSEIAGSFVWETAFAKTLAGPLGKLLSHAQNFSEIMHGAALLYNYMLARSARRMALTDEYGAKFGLWCERIVAARSRYDDWDLPGFWKIAAQSVHSITPKARLFVDDWIRLTLETKKAARLIDDERSVELIKRRESEVKPNRERLGNARALERWTEASGAGQIDFRWFRVKTIADDIRRSLS
ncbi:hypothetical protein I6F18_20975 [Bradyrhizobium sp. NBAIM32]|nr:hypothetical protein [Bradyrhizobium sp. NBAIM32]